MPDTVKLPPLARHPLHLFLILDCSGSMASDGKIQALNTAVREALPQLDDVDQSNPHAELFVRAITFSTGAQWHIAEPTRVTNVQWSTVTAGGYTDLGSALELLLPELSTPPMEDNALPPAIVLVSDGLPTDDYDTVLDRVLATDRGRESLRVAIAIGRDADRSTLAAFMGGHEPIAAHNPEQLADALRLATSRASVLASTYSEWIDPAPPVGSPRVASEDVTEMTW